MNLKPGFSRFLDAAPGRLHFAAHSHHPWPDVSFEAHQQMWLDAARLVDDKWDHIFGDVIPDTQSKVASILGLSDPTTLTFGPNTHGFLARIFSCLEPPVRVLTSDAEFHSFNRQSRRWEEAGLAIVDRVPAEPFETFADRFTREARAGVHDLVYLSQVFFDSGFVVPELDRVVSSVSEDRAYVVIDGYHGFMARPTNLGAIQDRVFFLAGGYKYAMAGEGACFLHSPPGYGARPVDTGWYAGFGQLETGVSGQIPYSQDGSRFAGATYDVSGIYRLQAVLRWLQGSGVTVADIRAYVVDLQDRFLGGASLPGELIPPLPQDRGNFLTFRSDDAGGIYRSLHQRAVITDYRADRLRIGFGIYQDEADVDRLIAVLAELPAAR
ncbi:MAG TPA: aminotransferase [Acidimicrobiia bacterium]|nr:aminotransferase [Acidimicrobiia bacterium]